MVGIRYLIKRSEAAKVLPDTAWQEYDRFRDGVISIGLKPQITISYGRTYFVYDEIKEKLFIQTEKIPDGIMLNCADIVSYELCRDGKAIEPGALGRGFGNCDGAYMGEECFDLHITITAKDGVRFVLPS